MAGEWRPSNWGDEVILEYGKAIRGYSKTQGKYRVFGSNGPIGWTSESLVQGPGVILGRKGAYRGVEYWRGPFWVIDTAYYLVPKTELDMRWLYYAVKHYKLGEVDDGSPIPSTTRAAVYMLELDVPPKPEQRAIAHILGTLDDKIELNHRRNLTLEAMARALFQDWFVDFGPVRAKLEGRAPYLSPDLWNRFPDRLDDEGKPEGWDSGRLDDALVLQRGFDLPASDRTYGVYPVMAASGVNGYHDKFMVKGPGITTGRSGVLGRVFFVHTDFWPLNTSLWVKEFKRVTPLYAFELLRGLDFEMFNSGSAVPTLNRNHVHNLPIILPPKQFIDAFDGQVTPMRRAQKKNEDECEFLAQLRDTLLPKLISGELRIADAEKFAGATQ